MVNRNYLRWKQVKCRNVVNEYVPLSIPETIALHYRGTLASEILQMIQKSPITFEAAINIVSEKLKEAFCSGNIGSEPGQYFWYTNNFISFISTLGYHIELTGDEFETYFAVKHSV